MATVLVVEDNSALARLYGRIINYTGCEVIQARTCKEAIQKLEMCVPDVILLDMALPDGNGLCVLNWLSLYPEQFGNTRVIVTSGDEKYEEEFERQGIEFLCKPVSLFTLNRLLNAYIKPPEPEEMLIY